ncbi:MAG: hypothetical protein KIT83_04540 [Bryobacterales bacterium]|nr:hypothetical protein [Bryobacterales bacterium]
MAADAQPCFRAGNGVDPSLLPFAPEDGFRAPAPDANGRLHVDDVVAAQKWQGESPLIVVVADDLAARGCSSLFGIADRDACVAVVSTFRLLDSDDNRLRERLSKVIAHEWMHLRGRGHCTAAGCLMHPVTTTAELDSRGHALCPRCRGRSSWKGMAVAAGIAVALFGGMDMTVNALQTKSRPFAWRAHGEAASVLYRGEEILRIPAGDANSPEGPVETAQTVSHRLNAMFVEIDPPPLVVETVGSSVRIAAGDDPLFVVTPMMAGEQDVVSFADCWATSLQPLLEGKGRVGESCPMCHIGRREQVRESVARPPRFWR